MRRRSVLIGLVAAMLPLGPVLAQTVGDQVAAQLRQLGYHDIAVERTLLGRVRITGVKGDRQREIIVNPNSGEILRDLATDSRTGAAASDILDDGEGTGHSGKSGQSGNDGGSSGSGSDSGGSGKGESGGDGSSGSSGSSGSGGDSDSGGSSGSGGGSDDGGSDDGGSDGGSDSGSHDSGGSDGSDSDDN